MKSYIRLLTCVFTVGLVAHGAALAAPEDPMGTTLTLAINGDKPLTLDAGKKKEAKYAAPKKQENLEIEVLVRYGDFWKVRFIERAGDKVLSEKILNLPKKSTEQVVFPGYSIVSSIK